MLLEPNETVIIKMLSIIGKNATAPTVLKVCDIIRKPMVNYPHPIKLQYKFAWYMVSRKCASELIGALSPDSGANRMPSILKILA